MPNQHFEKVYSEARRYINSCGGPETYEYNLKCSTPLQLVLTSYTLLKEINLFPKRVKRIGKSDKQSAKYRAEGNNAFRQKKDIIALKCYTKAVAFALANGKELALAYANRSAVTFSLEEYTSCVRDIDRAFSGCYPENLKYKLLERKGKCLIHLKRKNDANDAFAAALEYLSKSDLDSNKENDIRKNLETLLKSNYQNESDLILNNVEENHCNNLPTLSHPASDYIQVASKAVDIEFSNVMGRHVIASTDLFPGDVIAVEKPFASILLPNMFDFFCYMCKKRCHSLISCQHCTEAMFCSEICRKESWEQSHCIECDLLPILVNIGCENMELLAVKILMLATGAGKRLIELFTKEYEYESFDNPREKGFTYGKYLSDDYKSVHNLEMNDQVRNVSNVLTRSLMAASILYTLVEYTDFFKYYKQKCLESMKYYKYINEFPGGDGLTLAQGMVGGFLLRYLFSVPCNAHEVSEMRLKPKVDEIVTESVEVGGAIYPFLSLINHSCDPNVVRHTYFGDVVTLVAIKVIKEGEQIFDNYSYHHAIHSKEQRQTHLLSQYFFVCKCEACLYDWPLYASLPEKNPVYHENANKEEVEKSSEKFKTLLKEINSGKTDGKLPFLYKHLTLLHNSVSRRWKEYNQCQEAIKQCLSVQANHYLYKSEDAE